MAKRRSKKKIKKVDPEGVVHIHSSFNNTIITVTNNKGDTISWASSGTIGYKGSKKSTPFAASIATEKAVKAAMNLGMRAVEIWIKGPGSGREAAIRSVQAAGMKITAIKDVTPIPHNGCRPRKKRRV